MPKVIVFRQKGDWKEYIDGQRALTYSIPAMITMNQFITKKIHRDELVDIMFSIADQLMYLKANDMPLGKVILNIGYMLPASSLPAWRAQQWAGQTG